MKSLLELSGAPMTQEEKDNILLFSIRSIKYFLTWLILWQDSSVFGSKLQIIEDLNIDSPLRAFEIWLIIILLVLIIERNLIHDYSLKRSYFSAPFIIIGIALVISWIRGMWMLQEFRTVYELHESIQMPIIFFIFLNAYREPREYRILLLLIVLATIPKAADGLCIYLFAPPEVKSWGVLLMWRDGFLLALGVTTALLGLHYKGTTLHWLRKTMLIALPLIIFTLIESYRRTFFVGVIAVTVSMFFTLAPGRRLKQLWLFLSLILFFLILIVATGAVGFITRMFAVINPGDDGSAYIRLMELPNVLQNIYHNPIFGVPIGVQWHQYYRMPLFANFTTLGTHNTYLYWPLRTGILGTIGFLWMLAKMSKITLIFRRFVKSEEDHYYSLLSLNILIIYMVGCAFGLLYADGIIIVGVFQVALQLLMEEKFPEYDFKKVSLIRTMISGKITLKSLAQYPQPITTFERNG